MPSGSLGESSGAGSLDFGGGGRGVLRGRPGHGRLRTHCCVCVARSAGATGAAQGWEASRGWAGVRTARDGAASGGTGQGVLTLWSACWQWAGRVRAASCAISAGGRGVDFGSARARVHDLGGGGGSCGELIRVELPVGGCSAWGSLHTQIISRRKPQRWNAVALAAFAWMTYCPSEGRGATPCLGRCPGEMAALASPRGQEGVGVPALDTDTCILGYLDPERCLLVKRVVSRVDLQAGGSAWRGPAREKGILLRFFQNAG